MQIILKKMKQLYFSVEQQLLAKNVQENAVTNGREIDYRGKTSSATQ